MSLNVSLNLFDDYNARPAEYFTLIRNESKKFNNT